MSGQGGNLLPSETHSWGSRAEQVGLDLTKYREVVEVARTVGGRSSEAVRWDWSSGASMVLRAPLAPLRRPQRFKGSVRSDQTSLGF